MFGKTKSLINTCVKKSLVEAYVDEITQKSYEYSYHCPFFGCSGVELSYEDAVLIVEEVKKRLKSENLHRVIHMDYTGFTDGSDKVDYLLSKMEVQKISYKDDIVFGPKIQSVEKIKEFLNRMSYEYDFLDIYLPGEIWNELENFEIKVEDLDGTITSYKEAFFEDYKETEYGIRKNGYACTGHEYFEFICDKEDVYYNLSIILDYTNQFKKFLLTNNKYVEDILVRVNSVAEVPYILDNKNLIIQAIACNKILAAELTKENEVGGFSTKNIILKALDENERCYRYIDPYYKKDEEIFCKALDKDICLLTDIIDFNAFDEKNVKEKIKEILTGK